MVNEVLAMWLDYLREAVPLAFTRGLFVTAESRQPRVAWWLFRV